MKIKAFVLALFVAGFGASIAVAKGPPPGKGKDKGSTSSSTSSTSSTTTTSGKAKGKAKGKANAGAESCRRHSVVLKGTFVSAGEDSLVMHVKQTNAHGRPWVGEDAELEVDARTKFRRNGHAELEDFEAGDWLNVQARACTDEAGSNAVSGGSSGPGAGPASPAAETRLVARRVVGKPAKTGDSTTASP